jgi:predicted transcriptional regulator
MTKPAPYAKVAISLPEADLAAADRLAKELDRSRSWVVAEAVRRYAASVEQLRAQEDIGPARRAQLQRDLALTPEERVRAAEETLAVSAHVSEPLRFANFAAFLEWHRSGGASR